MKRWILCGGLLWASAAFAVSRVGGGTLTNVEEGLQSMDVPPLFQQDYEIFANDSVRFPGPIGIGGGMVKQQLINVYLLREQIPELSGVTDRAVFESYLVSHHWLKLATSDPCLEIFELPTGSVSNMVVGWGGGFGLLLAGPRTDLVTDGIMSAVQSIQLTPGACGWK